MLIEALSTLPDLCARLPLAALLDGIAASEVERLRVKVAGADECLSRIGMALDRAGKAVGVDHKTAAAARTEVGNFPTPASQRKSKAGEKAHHPPAAPQAETLVADKPEVPKKESLPTGDDETYVGHDVESNALCEELELKDRKEMQAPEGHIPMPGFLDRRREIATKVARPAPVNMVPRSTRQTVSTSAGGTD